MKYLLVILFSLFISTFSFGEALRLFSMNSTPSNDNLFVDLSGWDLWGSESTIKIEPSKHYRTGKKNGNAPDSYKLTYKKSNQILKELKIEQSDKIFIYDFALNKVNILKVENHFPLLVFRGPYTAEDYYFGFELDRGLFPEKREYYLHNYLIYIGNDNPFDTKKMRRIKWDKILNKQFPEEIFDRKHRSENVFINDEGYEKVKDSWGEPYWLKKTYRKDSYRFLKDNLVYNLYYLTRSEEKLFNEDPKIYSSEPSYLIQVKQKDGKVIFDFFGKSSESVSISPFKEETKSQWTGQLFKDRAPIYFNTLESFSFGCRSMYIMDKSAKPIHLLCNNRH